MGVAVHEDSCGDVDACCGPFEFVKMRYYFGQRLGVMELTDEQNYVVAKQRFHNLRLHGVGVLCGLTAERFVFPQNAPPDTKTPILRVRRGAALDACGREILVGSDQCIDLAAWFAKNRGRADLKDWKANENHPLWVGLRYHECPSDPAPAPREPCGCEPCGCEFGRVREGFKLALLTEQEHKAGCLGMYFPTADTVRTALNRLALEERLAPGMVRERLEQALGRLVGQACPEGTCEGWLCLARFIVTLADQNGTPVVTDISQPDNEIPERHSLLNTAALQGLVADLTAAAADEGLIGPGPSAGQLSFTPAAHDVLDTLQLAVQLASDMPLAEKTVDKKYFKVVPFDTDESKWLSELEISDVKYVNSSSPTLTLFFGYGLLIEGHYRLTLTPPPETPIVDKQMRPLRPARLARHFQLKKVNGTLTLADTLF